MGRNMEEIDVNFNRTQNKDVNAKISSGISVSVHFVHISSTSEINK